MLHLTLYRKIYALEATLCDTNRWLGNCGRSCSRAPSVTPYYVYGSRLLHYFHKMKFLIYNNNNNNIKATLKVTRRVRRGNKFSWEEWSGIERGAPPPPPVRRDLQRQ